ncbi:MAG: C39 family peptidase [Parcubacteria group bacterium]|jgi:uncharacterized protein YvpB
MKKVIFIILIVLFLAIAGGIFYRGRIFSVNRVAITQNEAKEKVEPESQVSVVSSESFAEPEKPIALSIPDFIMLDVPFVGQAPFQIWDALHEDACEEASLVMLKYFSDGKKSITKEQAEKEIQDMVAFEKKNGYKPSIALEELNQIASKYYKLENGRVGKNITIEDIKKELSNEKPVIVGAAGKVLPNPNFKNGGPNYHMLVIIGYDAQGFITNDPGTRLGEGFRYSFDDLLKSIHDWDSKNILNGGKDYLVFD